MEATLIEKNDTHAKIQLNIPVDEVSKNYKTVLREISKQIDVPGFRPGKVPRKVIETRIGKDAIAQEVRDTLLDKYLGDAIKQLELKVIGVDRTEVLPKDNEAFTPNINLTLYPDVTLPDIHEIVIDTDLPNISEENINHVLDNIRQDNAVLIPVERPAQAGDMVLLNLASDPDGAPQAVHLDLVDPEFAEQLIGHSEGKELTVEITLQRKVDTMVEAALEDTQKAIEQETMEDSSELPNLPAETLDVVITAVKEKDIPEGNDTLAQTLGYDNWEKVIEHVKAVLTYEATANTHQEQQDELVDKLVAESAISAIPDVLVRNKQEEVLKIMARDFEENGDSLQEYLESLNKEGNEEELKNFQDELVKNATEQVKRDLVLNSLMETSETSLTEEEMTGGLELIASRNQITVAELVNKWGNEGLENYGYSLTRSKAIVETLKKVLGDDYKENIPPKPSDYLSKVENDANDSSDVSESKES